MKGKKIIIFLIIINILLMGFIYVVLNKDIYILREKQLIKEMSETEQVTNKENQLNQSNTELLNYKTYIQQSKTNLAEAITHAGVDTEETDSFETMVSNINSIARHAEFKSLQLTANVEQTVNIGYEPKRIMFFGWEEDDEGCLFGVYDSYLNTKDIIRVSKNINAAWGGNGTYTSGNLTINDNGFTILLNSNAIGYTSNGTIYYVCE